MSEHPLRPFAGDAADAVIDRAVREIMSSEPRPGFRQRVLARLGDEPRTAWSWTRLGFAAGAVAMVVMLAFWARPEPTITPPVTAPPQRAAQPPGPIESAGTIPPPIPPTRRERRELVRTAPPAAADRRVTAASVNPVEEAAEVNAPTARPAIDPMTIAPLQVRPLETPEIIVRPVAVGPLMIVPVLPPR
jgi:hypothetical protein